MGASLMCIRAMSSCNRAILVPMLARSAALPVGLPTGPGEAAAGGLNTGLPRQLAGDGGMARLKGPKGRVSHSTAPQGGR